LADFTVTAGLWIFAILLGFKHSFDADHLVAVSGFLTNSPNSKHTSFLSISWALGHMLTASILTIVLYSFKETILDDLLANMELLVPFMLITIALLTIAWEFELFHFHRHKHSHESPDKSNEHSHFHFHIPKLSDQGTMIGIGFIHGIASNDELLLLFTLTLGITDLGGILIGVFLFTIGVIVGMLSYGFLINIPGQRWGHKRVTKSINLTIASLTLIYAFWLLLGLEGLNIIEFIAEILSG
jgi:hypothetical protein